MNKGCNGYLGTAVATEQNELKLEDIPIEREFPDVFEEDLSGLHPTREIEFLIDLTPDTGPISKTPYRTAPIELKELKDQLHKLLDKGYIQPNVSPQRALILL